MRRLPTERSTRIELVVPKDDAKLRLDRVLAKQLPEYSRSRLQQLIRAGFVRVNGITTRQSHLVQAGDEIELTEPPVEKIEDQPEPIPLEILFEDKDLIVINKPAGLVVHPGARHRSGTLVNALLHHCPTLSGIGGKIGRHPVHRQRMSVASSRGRAAKTEYRVVRSGEQASLIECQLHSGRTHQIRVHLHHLGHPVLGDKIYASRFARDFPRQMLHAWKIGFRHPHTGEWKNFEAPLPDDFAAAMKMTTESQQV